VVPEPDHLRREIPRLFEPQDPGEIPMLSSPQDLPELTELAGPGDPSFYPDVQASAEPAALLEASAEPENTSDWSPREEVLAISEPRVREVLDILPRSFREVETTRPNAPDIVFPSEVPDVEVGGGAPAPLPPPSGGAFPAGEGLPIELGRLPGPQVTPEPFTPSSPPELPPPEEEFPSREQLVATEDLLELRVQVYDPPDEPEVRYFKLQLMRNGIESLPAMPRDLVYLIDCSASMTEAKLQTALLGIRASLKHLDPVDRVQVIAFREEIEQLAADPLKATLFGQAQIRTFLSTLHAFGQTDVFASLQALQEMTVDPARPVLAMVITDGVPTQGVMDTGKILDEFTRQNQGEISVFGLGGGDRVNRPLLDFLSFQNRGFSLVSPGADGLSALIPQVVSELRRPVLTNLNVQFTGTPSPEVYPKSLSHLFVDRPWIVIGRTRRSPDPLAFQVVGTATDAIHDIVFELNLSGSPRGPATLRREWAWQAGLERWAKALQEGSSESFEEAASFFRRFQLEVPEAYRN
jgi:hypothetical protein